MKANPVKIATTAAIAMMLGACGGNSPNLETEVQNLQTESAKDGSQGNLVTNKVSDSENATSGASVTDKSGTAAESTDRSSQGMEPIFNSASLNSYRLSMPENSLADSEGSRADGAPTLSGTGIQTDSVQTASTIPDPYTEIPAIIESVFSYADTLYKSGFVDSATSYLERFRIIKPLWNTWEQKADSLLTEFGKIRAEKAKAFEPLVLEIQNMNRVQAAYSMVSSSVDSLIALAPGDSLIAWAKEQKQQAYRNTLSKALKEKTRILALAEREARFDEALKSAQEFQMRFRDFESELQISEFIVYLQKLVLSVSEENQKFWESNDPEKALAEADSLIKGKLYAKAKDLIEKLKASKIREKAAKEYQKLADEVCNEKRKGASQLYSKATKQKDSEKKKQLLLEAIAALTACSEEYPEYEKIKTVTDNITFLKSELDR